MKLDGIADVRRELSSMSPLTDNPLNITMSYKNFDDVVEVLNLLYEKGWNDFSDIRCSTFDKVETTTYSDGSSKETDRTTYYKIEGKVTSSLSYDELREFESWKEKYYDAVDKVHLAQADLKEASKYEEYLNIRKTPIASIILLLFGIFAIVASVLVIIKFKDPFLTFLFYSEEGSTMTYEELLAMYDLPAVMYDAVFPFTLLCVFLGPVALFISLMIKLRRVKNIKYSIKNRDQLEDGIAEARQRLEAAYNNLEKYKRRMPNWYSAEAFTKVGHSIYYFDKFLVSFD